MSGDERRFHDLKTNKALDTSGIPPHKMITMTVGDVLTQLNGDHLLYNGRIIGKKEIIRNVAYDPSQPFRVFIYDDTEPIMPLRGMSASDVKKRDEAITATDALDVSPAVMAQLKGICPYNFDDRMRMIMWNECGKDMARVKSVFKNLNVS